MLLSELLHNLEYKSRAPLEDINVKKVTSRIDEISKDTLFVWVRGVNYDTSKLYNEIIKRAPAVIVCEDDIEAECTVIKVENARKALSHLLSTLYKIDYQKTKFIGVTGTNGKTTTATIIYEILKQTGHKVGFIGTGVIKYLDEAFTDKTYSMTTPDPEVLYKSIRRMQRAGCEVIVMEVSSHAIALNKISPIPFKYSIFTNLSDEHLDFHKNMEDYFYTKLKLFKQTENGIFNADDEYSARAMREAFDLCNTTSVGIIWEAETAARDVILNGFDGSSYIYRDGLRIFKVNLSLVGYHNIYNSLLALRCVIDFGVPAYRAKEILKEIKSVCGRFEITKDDVCVIIDYAHTPEAFENVLRTVNLLKKPWQNITTVFGCGGDRDRGKRPKMAEIAEKNSSYVIVTEDNSRCESASRIFSDIMSGFSDTTKRKLISSRTEAITHAILEALPDDIILILGKGHERYFIDSTGYHDYDERAVISAAIRKRKETVRYK